eukprot:scaffold3080_cov171-Skeletonema_dohrnii-CCMP3373.AAC.10
MRIFRRSDRACRKCRAITISPTVPRVDTRRRLGMYLCSRRKSNHTPPLSRKMICRCGHKHHDQQY